MSLIKSLEMALAMLSEQISIINNLFFYLYYIILYPLPYFIHPTKFSKLGYFDKLAYWRDGGVQFRHMSYIKVGLYEWITIIKARLLFTFDSDDNEIRSNDVYLRRPGLYTGRGARD